MTEEKIKELKKQYHEEVVKNSIETIKSLTQKKKDIDETIARLDERIRRSTIVLEKM